MSMVNVDLTGAIWRKSSRTQANGECVEIAFPDADWRTSSHSQPSATPSSAPTSTGPD